MKFEIANGNFLKDGEPVKVFSGAVHYFRNMPDTWRDTFKKMKAAGLNCVETYCAWNMHEKKPGEFDFSGNLDVAKFIKMAQEEDLMVIVRPGPYICAEWEFGGIPWWVQADDEMEVRCMNEKYIERFDIYLDKIFEQIRPLLCTNGGPVIMVQCENEYAFYGNDHEYLEYLRDGYIKRGIDVPLFTSDGPWDDMYLDSAIEGCLPTLNFGSNVEQNLKSHYELFPDLPKMCMEMWDGWFDSWGQEHHTTSCEAYMKTVKDMAEHGHFNIYMFIGGTNFGFMNGANNSGTFCPTITSYDYDSILTEWGDVTPKYMMLRELLSKYHTEELAPVPENRKKMAYGKVSLNESADLFKNLDIISKPIFSKVTKAMEYYGIGYGYIAYKTILTKNYAGKPLILKGLGDRAHIFVNKNLVGIIYVNDEKQSIDITANKGDELVILVENMGRENFGPYIMRKKGLDGKVLFQSTVQFNWDVYPLEMNNLELLEYDNKPNDVATFYKGSFEVKECFDTFIRLDNFKKGFVTINGFNIGRYWEIGPQKTLYIPASLLKEGKNEVIVFESDGLKGEPVVEFTDIPDIG